MIRLLTILCVLAIAGFFWPMAAEFAIGEPTGEGLVGTQGMAVYLPILTSLLVATALSVGLWIKGR